MAKDTIPPTDTLPDAASTVSDATAGDASKVKAKKPRGRKKDAADATAPAEASANSPEKVAPKPASISPSEPLAKTAEELGKYDDNTFMRADATKAFVGTAEKSLPAAAQQLAVTESAVAYLEKHGAQHIATKEKPKTPKNKGILFSDKAELDKAIADLRAKSKGTKDSIETLSSHFGGISEAAGKNGAAPEAAVNFVKSSLTGDHELVKSTKAALTDEALQASVLKELKLDSKDLLHAEHGITGAGGVFDKQLHTLTDSLATKANTALKAESNWVTRTLVKGPSLIYGQGVNPSSGKKLGFGGKSLKALETAVGVGLTVHGGKNLLVGITGSTNPETGQTEDASFSKSLMGAGEMAAGLVAVTHGLTGKALAWRI